MTVSAPDESQVVYETTLALAREHLAPIAEQIDRDDEFPRAFWQLLADHGLLGGGIPEQYGGSGGDYIACARACEAVTQVSPAVALSYGAHLNLCAHNIMRNGTEDHKTRYLPGLCDGSSIGAMALTEPDYGSDAMGIQLHAEPDGTGWTLTGSKTFITNAPIADVIVVYARTSPGSGSRGLTAFVIDTPRDGLTAGTHFDKMGMRGSPTGELFFDGVAVSQDDVLGEVDNGFRVVMSGLDLERAFLSYLGLGVAQECLELSIKYARERAQFGQPIASFQLIQAKIADMYTQLFAARAAADQALRLSQTGVRASKECAAALLFAGEQAVRTAEEAVQIHGGSGYLRESPVQRYWRDSKLATIGAGTSEIRRLLIARELLGQR